MRGYKRVECTSYVARRCLPVIMWKSAFIFAVTANVIFTVSTEGVSDSRSSASSLSSSQSSSSSSSSSSYSSSTESSSSSCASSQTTASNEPREPTTVPQCNKPNEVYDVCPAPCPPRLCGVDVTVILCQVPPQPGDPACEPGCRCIDNYVKNDDGICIPKDQCPAVSCKGDPNAQPGCGVNCGRLCSNYKETDVSCIQVCYEDGCDCKKNYVLDSNTGKCVLPEQCTPTCKINEVFSNCTQAICRAQDCSQKGQPIACAAIAEGYCKSGCVCAENYLRDSNGNCVPEDQCEESCDGDPNARPGCGVNCGRLCSNYKNGNQIACPAICNLNGCDCKEGYVLDDNTGKCVLPDQCPAVSCKGDPNAQPGCGVNCGRLCSNYKETDVSCIQVCYEDGCDCKKNYVLDSNTGKCVLPEQCTPTCKVNEVFSNCTQAICRAQDCSQKGQPIACAAIAEGYCKSGCVCAENYLRDSNGNCVPEDQCEESCGGDPNARPGCGVNCGRLCSNYKNGNQIACPAICNLNGCDCKEGYVLDDNTGKCVLPDQCPDVSCNGDPNAQPGCGVNCGRLCSNYKESDVSCIQVCYEDGCDCKENYVLDSNTGKCVLPEQCSTDQNQCNKPNEEYQQCPDCSPGTCESIGKKYNCPLQPSNSTECTGECRCKAGYYRNKIGECITKEECLQCNGPNEYFSCGPACDNVCATLDQQSKDNCPIKNIQCNKKCYCEDGYARDQNNICVPIDQCNGINQNQCNKPNEEYQQCPDCSPGTCESIGKNYNCPVQPSNSTECTGECRCKAGYFRNKIGECITEEECQQCDGPNEYFSCGPECDNVCATLDQQSKDNCPIINVQCNKKCYCEDGYARNDNNICIPIDQCNGACKVNERYVECPDAECVPQTCADAGFPVACPRILPGRCPSKPACICNSGFLKNSNGVCVPQNECPSCGGDPNATPGCGVNCGRLCSNYQNSGEIACPLICNLNGCDCNEGYVLDTNTGKCVLPEQCNNNQNQCNKPNEEYQQCPDCSPGTCESIGKKYNCPLKPSNSTECTGECRCKAGYYRNKIGECIKEEECQQCTGPNEYFSCGPECDNVCATLDQQSKDNCPIINVQCNKKCYCEDGYARNENNICIPIDQCNGGCKVNERYVKCPDAECVPQTCADAGFPVACPRIVGRCPSKPACICSTGYFRNSDGVCVPQDQCPSCGGDPNAKPGCGVNCGRLCSNYQNSSEISCIEICNLNGCDCNEGYVLDTNTGKCVLPEQCTSPCPENEVYSTCVNGGCDKRNCSQINDPKICIDPLKCEEGCVCQNGYLRDSNRVCVPQDQCEGRCPDGETFSDCPPVYSKDCNSELCPRSRNDPPICATTRQCGEPRCVCAYLRKRNRKTGKCVLASDCPPFPCKGQNEVYDSCPPSCPGETCSDYINNSTCPKFRIGIVVPCKPACRCDKNTFRNQKGICVSADECESSIDRPPKVTTDAGSDNQLSDLEQGNTAFTNNFLYQVLTSNPGENLIMSPFSVLIPLAELALYSSGSSLKQLLKVFNLQNKDQVRSTFPNLINKLGSGGNNTLDLGARVYVNQDYKLTKDFKDDTDLFNAKADTMNVKDPNGAAAKINDWVSDITRGKITDLISPDMITALTRLVLANAIYFKGTWKTQFDSKDTKDQDFYITKNETAQVKMMNLKDKFNYAEISDIDAKVLQLPYVGEDMSLIAILPNQIDGLLSLVEKLRDEAVFNKAINSLSSKTVSVSLPKMDISTTIDLKKILKQSSGLNGIITNDEDLFVTDAIEKATFTADEKGSEATAANAVVIGTRSLPRPPPEEYTFKADHPFVFAITFKQLILFIGTFVK